MSAGQLARVGFAEAAAEAETEAEVADYEGWKVRHNLVYIRKKYPVDIYNRDIILFYQVYNIYMILI